MKILLVKTSSLGDIVHTFPVVSYLRERFPNATIDWVAESPFAALPAAHPGVDRVHLVDSKRWWQAPLSRETWSEIKGLRKALKQAQYDVVFDLQANIKSGLINWLTACPNRVGFDRAAVSEWPNLLTTHRRISLPPGLNIRFDNLRVVQSYFEDLTPPQTTTVRLKISDAEKERVKALLTLPEAEGRAKILVCAGSAWPNKRLPSHTLIEFLKKIQAATRCHYLLGWGSAEEQHEALVLSEALPSSSLMPRLALPTLQNLMNDVDLVLAMDSLPLHLAGTTTTRTFSLFGPSLAAKFQPLGREHNAFQGTCPYGRTFEKRCPILRTCPTGACLRDRTSDELFERFSAAEGLLTALRKG